MSISWLLCIAMTFIVPIKMYYFFEFLDLSPCYRLWFNFDLKYLSFTVRFFWVDIDEFNFFQYGWIKKAWRNSGNQGSFLVFQSDYCTCHKFSTKFFTRLPKISWSFVVQSNLLHMELYLILSVCQFCVVLILCNF